MFTLIINCHTELKITDASDQKEIAKLVFINFQKKSKTCQWHRSGLFIVNFEHISRLVLVFLLLTLSWEMPIGYGLSR